MRWRPHVIASGLIALTLIPALGQVADPATKAALSADDRKTIETFERAAKAYLDIPHNAPSQEKLKNTTDVSELDRRREALKQTIRAARPNAKRGDLFTPPAAALFRKLMTQAMTGPSGNVIRHSLDAAEPVAAAESAQIGVNRDYPNQEGQPLQSSPPTLLQNLPVLPKGLEYRMVGNILVLRDAEANIVVDYLPNALK